MANLDSWFNICFSLWSFNKPSEKYLFSTEMNGCGDNLHVKWLLCLVFSLLLCVRFQVEHVLSEPSECWTGWKGQVNEPILTEMLSRPDGSKCYVCVCGPAAFTELTLG